MAEKTDILANDENNTVDVTIDTTNNDIRIDDNKYQTLLNLINMILKNIDHPTIEKLTDFIDIDRDCIIKDENKKLIFDNEKDFFPPFDKTKFAWSRRNCTRHYILTFIKYACNELGLNFKSQKQRKMIVHEGVKYHKFIMTYSITSKTIE